MFRLLLAGSILCSSIAQGRAADTGQDVLVTVVTGTAMAAGKLVETMDRLPPQRTLVLETGAKLVLFRLRDGLETTLTGPGTFAVRDRDIVRTGGTGILQVRRTDEAFHGPAPQATGLTQAGVTLRAVGVADAAGADAPQWDARLPPGIPTFRWGARAHEGDYGFLLADADDRVLAEARPSGSELVLTDVRLAPDTRYRWELTWRDPAGQMRMVTYRFATMPAAAP